MATTGRRRNNRVMLSSPLQISWVDPQGKPHCRQAMAIDISDAGIRFALPELLAETAPVQIRCHALGMTCTGVVRTCAPAGTKYAVGIEFVGGARFDRVRAGVASLPRRR